MSTLISAYLASQFKPNTLAAMIADLMEMPAANAQAIKILTEQLRALVGDEDAEMYLAEAGIAQVAE